VVSTWSWISRRRESGILERELEHLEKIRRTVEATLAEAEALNRGDLAGVEKAYDNVFNSEREADEIKSSIIDELSEGLIHPIDREELIRLVLGADDIAAYAKSAGRRMLILSKLGERPPEDVGSSFIEIARLALESVDKIIEAVKIIRKDSKRAIKLSEEVERLEEKADEVRLRTEEELIKWCNENRPGTCLLLYRILEALEESTDKCEDVADILRSIAILSA
jgi:predicted phosphate transport protein (TIGR00153 family)